MQAIILLCFFVFTILYIIVRDKGERSAYSFLISDRSVSPFRIAASLSSGFRDGAGIAAWVAFGYYFDVGAIWLFVGMACALLLLSIVAPKIRSLVNGTEIYSLNQLVDQFIGKKTAYFTVFLLTTTATLITGAQLYVSGTILSILLNIPSLFGILLIASFVGLYLIIGGFRAVILTDIFEWFILFIIFFVPLLLTNRGVNIYPKWDAINSPGNLIYSLVPLVFLIVFTGGDVWQRIFSALDEKSARQGLLLTVPFYLAISVGVVILSLSIKAVLPNAAPGTAFFSIFNENLFSGWFLAVLGVFTVAAITSTVDTQTYVFASSIASVIRKKKVDTLANAKEDVKVSRWIIIGFLIAVSVIAYSIGDIVVFLFSSYSILTIIFPVLLLIIVRGKAIHDRNDLDAWIFAVMILSALVYGVLWALGYYSNLAFTLAAPITAIIGTLSVMSIFKKKSHSR